MHFSHAVVLAFIAATASAQYGYSERSYAGIAKRYADPAVGDYGPGRSFPVRRSAYPKPDPILGINHAKKVYHAAKKHFGHHKDAGQAGTSGASQGSQGQPSADPSADPAAALGRRWAYPEPEAHGFGGGFAVSSEAMHEFHNSARHRKKPGNGAAQGAAQAAQGAPATPPAVPAAAPAANPAAAAAAPAPAKRWAILDAYSKLMARDAEPEPEPENSDEIWERDAEAELEFEERDAEPELDLEERDFDDELYSFMY
ncbi:hypothetical protein MMC34_003512 [Xylographa carneopallida]|nr:hypothetical protein [Xylographa carneopallida]